ncbi:MAG: hypothetical protein ABW210_02795, partial [Achromobacter sp.]
MEDQLKTKVELCASRGGRFNRCLAAGGAGGVSCPVSCARGTFDTLADLRPGVDHDAPPAPRCCVYLAGLARQLAP